MANDSRKDCRIVNSTRRTGVPPVAESAGRPFEEAAKLNDRDALEDAIRDSIEQATKALRLR